MKSKSQLAKDIRTAIDKIKVLKKLSIKSWLVISLFVFLTVSLLAGLYVSQRSTEDRSGATGGAPDLYFSPATAVLTQDAQGHLQPVQNIEIRVSAGRPIVSYSFVMKLTDLAGRPVGTEEWSKITFVANSKFVNNDSVYLDGGVPLKLFVGTIGQQPNGNTQIGATVTDGLLGSFRFTPSQADQQDLLLSFYTIPGKPEANSLYVLGRLLTPPAGDGEVQIPQENFHTFNLHNPYLAIATPTPAGHDIDAAWFWYKSSNTDAGRPVAAKFDGYNVGGTLQTFTDLDHIDPIWQTASLAPSFRIRVKKPDGTYRTTVIDGATTDVLVESSPRGSFAERQFWANWKVTGTANALLLTLPNTNNSLPIFRGDVVEATINLKRIDSGTVYNCTINNRLVVYPVGQPGQQQELGACDNFSKALLEFATPVPTDTPAPPPATATPTSTQQSFSCPTIHTTLLAMTLNNSLPVTGTNDYFASYTLSSQMASQVTSRWSRLVRNGTTTVICASANIETTNLNPTASGIPAILQSKVATPCVIPSAGFYLPQTLFRLTDGRTVTCDADRAISVQ